MARRSSTEAAVLIVSNTSENKGISPMGNFAECWVGEFYIGSTKNNIDPSIMQLFRFSDKRIVTANKSNLPNQYQLRRWAADLEDLEDEDNIDIVFYSSPVKFVKERLELIGYSLTNAKKAYSYYLDNKVSFYEKLVDSSKIEILNSMNPDKWLLTLREIYENRLIQNGYESQSDNNSSVSYMLGVDWYGCPATDLNIALRLALEVLPENENFVYDVTDLILCGYFDTEENLADYPIITSPAYPCDGKCIILTEGKSDTFILSESLKLLYPHLSELFFIHRF